MGSRVKSPLLFTDPTARRENARRARIHLLADMEPLKGKKKIEVGGKLSPAHSFISRPRVSRANNELPVAAPSGDMAMTMGK